jgi:hypothetical protein
MEQAGSHRETPAGRLRINASAGAARQMEPIVFKYRRLWLQRRTTASARKAAVHTQTASRSAYQFGIRLGEGALSRSQWEAATSMPWWRVRTSGVRRSRFYPAEKAAVASVTNVT